MCYSLAGRIQTRLSTFLVPALLVAWAALRVGDQRYVTMFVVMVVISLDLDIAVYHRTVTYQSRWLTYLLGITEFFILYGAVRGLGGTLPLRWIVAFYAVSWLSALLIVNVVLPVVDPMWSEHGGEFWRPAVPLRSRDGSLQIRIARLRAWLTAFPDRAFTLAALGLLTALQLTSIPGALSPEDVLVCAVTALAAGEIGVRASGGRAGSRADDLALGLTVALLLRDGNPLAFALAAALAVAARDVLRFSGRPLLNGAAGALVLCVLFVPGAYAADGQWGNSLILPLVIANLALLGALLSGRLTLVVSFGAVLLGHALWASHLPPDSLHQWLQVWLPRALPAYLLFFAGFVLPDRASTPSRALLQLAMGLGVGATGVMLGGLGIGLPFAVALLIWTYVAGTMQASWWAYRSRRSVRRHPGEGELAHSSRTGVSRRAFLGALTAAVGSVIVGGSVKRLIGLDPAILSIPPDPVLAGGQAIPRFADVGQAAGIVLAHHADPNVGSPAIGTGVAWGDYDMDGNIDLYVTDQMAACHLYRNNGDGTFTDVAPAAGVSRPGGRPTSATFVDYDNDGWPDLYVGVADGPNVLFHNNGDGTFTDVTDKSGLGEQLGRTMATAWADYDGDGYLDVFVANYPSEPVSFDGNVSIIEDVRTVKHMSRPHNRLYHNNGDGTFSDVTTLLGDLAAPATRGFGFSAVWFDYNNDGRPDLYAAYDFGSVVTPNTLWRNDGPGPGGWRFTQVEGRTGVAAQANTMGAASGDYNNDGWIDLAVSNIGPNYLYQNAAGRTFVDVARRAGVAHAVDRIDNALNPSMTWGLGLADFNNDGWLDLYLVAGAMDFEDIPQPNALYLNDGKGRFVDVSAASGADDPGQGRSVAVADYDNDGRLDMFVANYGQPPLLYRNVSRDSGNHWLRVELEGTQSNRDAVGARAHLHVSGLPAQMREVQIGQGLGSCDAKALHFGLGAARMVDRIDIRWPSGHRQTLWNVPADQTLTIREPGHSRWRAGRGKA